MIKRILTLITTCCIGLLFSQGAHAFRCGNSLVTKGDSQISVLKKCGKPDWKNSWTEETIKMPDTDNELRIVRIVENWIYNPGPTQFLRIVKFYDGKVSSIETGNRGFIEPTIHTCEFDNFSIGTTTAAEVTAQCGEPDSKVQRLKEVTHKIENGRKKISIIEEEWTFNLGPNQFMRILIFNNGSLSEIKTGEKGFN